MNFADGMEEAMRLQEEMGDAGAAYWSEGAPDVDAEDISYTGAGGQPQAARIYHGGNGPPVFYIHGGGWVGGSIDMNDRACRALASHGGSDVVSVSYRLAPEHPYPAGLEDCRAALAQVRPLMGGNPMVLSGASAGANLALALALDEQAAGLILFYGVFGADLETGSHQTYAEGFGLTRARVDEIYHLYDPGGVRFRDPRICPLNASDAQLTGLPPSLLVAAEHDVLRDDTVLLAARLAALDVPHRLEVEPGVTHGFINRGRLVPAADACLMRAADFLTDLGKETRS